jgi:3-oxoacyl-[acyl-carrier-protein] synthase-3
MEEIEAKNGIMERHIAGDDECASDLGVIAAQKLFASQGCYANEIDYLIFCTQSPDYFLPTTACLIQDRLQLPTTAGALDINMGCSGFIYGLSLAKGLIETGQSRKVLLITAETYSKYIQPTDRSVRTIFGDGAAATLIHSVDEVGSEGQSRIGPFVFGTDGKGSPHLIVKSGGLRNGLFHENSEHPHLHMKGSEIFAFTLKRIPLCVNELLERVNKPIEDVDLFVFHQANQYMVEHLRQKLKIPTSKFCVALKHYGNTVSSTIPIALKDALKSERLKSEQNIMLVGFGVGYSWGATFIRWTEDTVVSS